MYQKNPKRFVSLQNQKSSFLSFIVFFIVTCITTAYAQTMQTSQVSVYTRLHANVGGFLESLPNDYAANPTKKYPLLIAMHGVGERGNGAPGILEKVANVAIPKRIKTGGFPASFTVGGKSFSFIVISPQMENASDWRASIQAVIDYSKKHYRVDESRIYLTGLSLGGVCEWVFLGNSAGNSQQLAAALLVTPGTGYTAAQLKNVSTAQLPIWVTNNTGDPYNSPGGATALVNALNNSVPAPPKALITIFNKSGHDAWTQTYDPAFKQNGLNVYEWMLTKTRGATQPAPVTPVLTANAGPDQILTLPANTIALDASASKVTSGTITSYSWAKVSGPTIVSLTALSAGVQAKLTNLVAGTYVYQLTVKDSNGSTATDNVTITVNAAPVSTDPPVVNAGLNQTITLPVNSVNLDGSSSTASAGNTIVSYQWTKTATSPAGGDITSADSAKTFVGNLMAGTYTYTLTITDSRGVAKTASVSVIVNAAPASTDPPVVNAGLNQTITLPTSTVGLDGSLSQASAGNTIVSYQWTKTVTSPAGGDIISADSAKTTVSNLMAGTYTYTLTITDSRGSATSGGTMVVVNSAPTSTDAPIANAGKGQTITLPGNTVNLDGSLSKASAGNTIVSYKWAKSASSPAGGDITSPNSVGTTVTNLTGGTYIFNLTVIDSRGASKTGGTQIIVNGTASSIDPPTAKVAESMINQTLPSNSATLDGSSSVASAGNTIVSYKWTKYTGPKYDGLKTPTNPTLTVTGLVAGSYGFTLTVTDNNGKISRKNVAVIVKAAPSTRTASAETAANEDVALSNGRTVDVKAFEVSIAPNPVQSTMNIRVNGSTAGKTSILVYNVAGQLQLQQEFTKDGASVSKQLNIAKLQAGIYIAQIIIDAKYKQVIRFVKQ